MRAQRFLKPALLITLTALTSACGSSGAPEDNTPASETTPPPATRLPTVQVQTFAPRAITEESAPEIAKSAYLVNRYLLRKMRDELDGQDLERGENLSTASFSNGTLNLDA